MPAIESIEGLNDRIKVASPPAETGLADLNNTAETNDLASRVNSKSLSTGFPNLPLAMVQLALVREQVETKKIHELSESIKQKLATSNLLLQLSSNLAGLPADKNSHAIPDKSRDLMSQLENLGVSLPVQSKAKDITKDQIAAMKVAIGELNITLRSDIQSKVATEAQPTLTRIQSIMNVAGQIVRDAKRENETYIRNQIAK